jgi:hypothetical protein
MLMHIMPSIFSDITRSFKGMTDTEQHLTFSRHANGDVQCPNDSARQPLVRVVRSPWKQAP